MWMRTNNEIMNDGISVRSDFMRDGVMTVIIFRNRSRMFTAEFYESRFWLLLCQDVASICNTTMSTKMNGLRISTRNACDPPVSGFVVSHNRQSMHLCDMIQEALWNAFATEVNVTGIFQQLTAYLIFIMKNRAVRGVGMCTVRACVWSVLTVQFSCWKYFFSLLSSIDRRRIYNVAGNCNNKRREARHTMRTE